MDIPFESVLASLDRTSVGLAQVDLHGAWILVSNRFCEMLGYSEAELLSKTLPELIHPDDKDASLAGLRKLLAGDVSTHTMEKRYIRKDGTILRAKVHRSLVSDHDGAP